MVCCKLDVVSARPRPSYSCGKWPLGLIIIVVGDNLGGCDRG